MKEIVDTCKDTKAGDHYINEDVIFSTGCDTIHIHKPTAEEAKSFSVETIYHDKSFGIHKAYAYLDTDKIAGWCPGIRELKTLNNG